MALAILQGWVHRFWIGPDSLSYLDMGDACVRGDWGRAFNTYWSPLYSWLVAFSLKVLGPPPAWEAPVVHLVNLVIYAAALAAFDFFWRQLRQTDTADATSGTKLAEWAWILMGYSLFTWSMLVWISVWQVSPDLWVAAWLFLIAGLLLKIRRGVAARGCFALFGTLLGLAYWTKLAMFPVALLFLAVGLFTFPTWRLREWRRSLRRILPGLAIATFFFLLVSSPLIAALSLSKGRLTIGDAARLNYGWYVNGVRWGGQHWQGEEVGSGMPEHATRRIGAPPVIYEFATPVAGTYPPWNDPSYWHEGLEVYVDPAQQLRVLWENLKLCLEPFFIDQAALWVGTGLLLGLGWRVRSRLRASSHRATLLLLSTASLSMYALVHVELRFLGAFVVFFWGALWSGVRLPPSPAAGRFAHRVVLVMAALTLLSILKLSAVMAYKNIDTLLAGRDTSGHVQWQLATGLHRHGVEPGDHLAFISSRGMDFYWARLAGVRVTAEIFGREDLPDSMTDVEFFWNAGEDVHARVMTTFAGLGVRGVVSEGVPSDALSRGWRQIGSTPYYFYRLAAASRSETSGIPSSFSVKTPAI